MLVGSHQHHPQVAILKNILPNSKKLLQQRLNIMSAPILVPTLGESVTEATVAKWIKKNWR